MSQPRSISKKLSKKIVWLYLWIRKVVFIVSLYPQVTVSAKNYVKQV